MLVFFFNFPGDLDRITADWAIGNVQQNFYLYFFLASLLISSLVCFVEHLDSILDQANTFKSIKTRQIANLRRPKKRLDWNRSQR